MTPPSLKTSHPICYDKILYFQESSSIDISTAPSHPSVNITLHPKWSHLPLVFSLSAGFIWIGWCIWKKKEGRVFVNIAPVTVINYVGAWPHYLWSKKGVISLHSSPIFKHFSAPLVLLSHSKTIIPHHCQIQEEVSMSWWQGSNSPVSNFTSRCSVELWLNLSILPDNIPHLLWNNFTEIVDKQVTSVLLWNV